MEQEFLRSSCFRPAPKAKEKALEGQPVKGKPILSGQANLKKRKREAALLEDSPGSGESNITCRKLTQRNLELWNEENDRKMYSSHSTQSQRVFTCKQSCPTDLSSQSSIRSSQSCAANSPLFETKLRDLGVRFSNRYSAFYWIASSSGPIIEWRVFLQGPSPHFKTPKIQAVNRLVKKRSVLICLGKMCVGMDELEGCRGKDRERHGNYLSRRKHKCSQEAGGWGVCLGTRDAWFFL